MKKRIEPKPMKPVKAWALVDKDTGAVRIINMNMVKSAIKYYQHTFERIARVVITEVKR